MTDKQNKELNKEPNKEQRGLLEILKEIKGYKTNLALLSSASNVFGFIMSFGLGCLILTGLFTKVSNLGVIVNPQAYTTGYKAQQKALQLGYTTSTTWILVDFTKPSSQKRLYVYKGSNLVYSTEVAQGTGSGLGEYATKFSNIDGSHMSSIGVMKLAETYIGHNGSSIRLNGLEPGFNSNVRGRMMVIHQAAYVYPGHAGHSYGCFAVSIQARQDLNQYVKAGDILVSYYPDQNWINNSRFLK